MTTRATDPAFNKNPDTASGTYEDVNGVGKDFTINFQYPENGDSSIKEPLNKREYMATEILKTLVGDDRYIAQSREQNAEQAVRYADALIDQLNNISIP